MTRHAYVSAAAAYYEGKLSQFGPTPGGVDWNSEASQRLRFDQLLRSVEPTWPSAVQSINDYGCGYGALAGYLERAGFAGEYRGYDASPKMIEEARRAAGGALRSYTFERAALEPADLTVASGIFNVKLQASDSEWRDYVFETIADLAALSRRAFTFNVLTSYSDPERRRSDLFYADPLDLFDHCKRTLSPYVTLVHDYPLYEFSIGVFLNGPNGKT